MNFMAPARAILIRVAVDQAYGNWNAPCNPESGDFVYVSIPQTAPNIAGMERWYDKLVKPALVEFSARNQVDVSLPQQLHGGRMHLDPDYDNLSYGDTAVRGKKLLSFRENDWVVFYSSLRPIHGGTSLVYALTGLLVVESIRRVHDIPESEFDQNAHTRLLERSSTDIVVRGKLGISGRFSKYIDIGEFRNNSYRVRKEILDAWGGLSVNDGWIQRSANPPLFLEPDRFYNWFISINPGLQQKNN